MSVLIGVGLATAGICAGALAGLAALFVVEAVRRIRRRRTSVRRMHLQVAQLLAFPGDDVEAVARGLGLLDDDSGWER